MALFVHQIENRTRGRQPQILREIDSYDVDDFRNTDEAELIAYFIDKFSLVDVPQLDVSNPWVEASGESPASSSGHYVIFGVPYSGDPELFQYHGSHRYLKNWDVEIKAGHILLRYSNAGMDSERLKQGLEQDLNQIVEMLGWLKQDCDRWNDVLSQVVKDRVRWRKERLAQQSKVIQGLDLPIKRRADMPKTFDTPVKRRPRPVPQRPAVKPEKATPPEPILNDGEYEYILGIVEHLSQAIERSPETFARMDEENIRDVILVDLNGHYQGSATGETFNAEGKTDILIRADGRNAFIAECKFWRGQKKLQEAIDQILGYLTWRDTKTSLIVFNKNVGFTKVLDTIWNEVPKHPAFKKELRAVSETQRRYSFRQKNDPERELFMAVQVFDIPPVPSVTVV